MNSKPINKLLKPLIDFIEINGFSEISLNKPNCILARNKNDDWVEYGVEYSKEKIQNLVDLILDERDPKLSHDQVINLNYLNEYKILLIVDVNKKNHIPNILIREMEVAK